MEQKTITRLQRRAILRSADQKQANIRIDVIPGIALAPRTMGKPYWKTNFVKRYPSGKCFSKTLYTPSTRRVEVGELWIWPVQ